MEISAMMTQGHALGLQNRRNVRFYSRRQQQTDRQAGASSGRRPTTRPVRYGAAPFLRRTVKGCFPNRAKQIDVATRGPTLSDDAAAAAAPLPTLGTAHLSDGNMSSFFFTNTNTHTHTNTGKNVRFYCASTPTAKRTLTRSLRIDNPRPVADICRVLDYVYIYR